MLHDKDIQSTLEALAPVASNWYPASLSGPRAAKAAELCQFIPKVTEQFSTPVEAFEAAMTNAKAEDVILVVGSFHTVGEVLEHWQKKGV
jgi:dihydrofolate synthase/folylpolyglutamate synthase